MRPFLTALVLTLAYPAFSFAEIEKPREIFQTTLSVDGRDWPVTIRQYANEIQLKRDSRLPLPGRQTAILASPDKETYDNYAVEDVLTLYGRLFILIRNLPLNKMSLVELNFTIRNQLTEPRHAFIFYPGAVAGAMTAGAQYMMQWIHSGPQIALFLGGLTMTAVGGHAALKFTFNYLQTLKRKVILDFAREVPARDLEPKRDLETGRLKDILISPSSNLKERYSLAARVKAESCLENISGTN